MSPLLKRLRTEPRRTNELHNRSFRISTRAQTAKAKLPNPKLLSIFEGPVVPFRDYSDGNDLSSHTESLTNYANEFESQLVVPSRILLDGSSVPSSGVGHVAQAFSTNVPSPSQSVATSSPRSSIPSLRSLQEKTKRSSSVLKHIQSALRFSSTDSWRSSLSLRSSVVSVESLLRIQRAAGSLIHHRSSTSLRGLDHVTDSEEAQFRTIAHFPPMADWLPSKENKLSESEERVWTYLMEDDVPNGPFLTRPSFDGMSLTRRACCKAHGAQIRERWGVCEGCGTREEHWVAKLNLSDVSTLSDDQALRLLSPRLLNKLDYFGNAPLHFAAASATWHQNCVHLILLEANLQWVNTSGATFLHVVFEHFSLEELPQCLKFVQYIDGKFDFSSRDYHGRTVLHMLFDNLKFPLKDLSREQHAYLWKLANIVAPDRSVVDNLGRDICQLLGSNKEEITDQDYFSEVSETTFQVKLSRFFNFDTTSWIRWLSSVNKHTWVDSDGDTALIALMKTWQYERDETELPGIIGKMFQSGTVIHMRDRKGDTALAIAARRGLRPAVTALTDLGACTNSRNYLGTSIFEEARRELRQAIRNSDEKLYAMILSCILVLDDRGAVKHPDGYQEWALPSSPLAKRPAPLSRVFRAQNQGGSGPAGN